MGKWEVATNVTGFKSKAKGSQCEIRVHNRSKVSHDLIAVATSALITPRAIGRGLV